MEPERLEHLKMLQSVINRMAQNSFVAKGWSVALATGILAASVAGREPSLGTLALLPILAFWGLDAFYLRQERLFRALHADVCAAFGNVPVTFSMDTGTVPSPIRSWVRTLFARVVVGLHGPLVMAVIVTVEILKRRGAGPLTGCV